MNAPFAIAATGSDATPALPALRGFALDNAEQLEWVLAANGCHHQLAALRHLVEDLHDEVATPEDAYEILSEIRDLLSSLPVYNPFGHLHARPDLDACLRWLGGQLDDLLGLEDEA